MQPTRLRLALTTCLLAIGCGHDEGSLGQVAPEAPPATAAAATSSAALPSVADASSAAVVAPAEPDTSADEAGAAPARRGVALARKELAGRAALVASLQRARKAAEGGGTREVHGKDSFDIVVGAKLRAALPGLKDAMLALIDHTLDEIGPSALTASSADLTATVLRAFEDAGVKLVESDPGPGALVALRVVRLDGHATRLAADFSIEFGLGGDDVLAVFEQQGAGFAPVLVRRHDGYESVRSARWLSTWAVSPPAADGSWFVIDANSHAWITSLWRGIRYGIYEVGPRPDSPLERLQRSDSAFIGEDEAGSVGTTVDTATVSYAAWDTLGGGHTRSYTRTFRRTSAGGAATFARVAPYVSSPRDLVHELQLADEPLARSMAVSGAGDQAVAAWKLLHGKGKDDTLKGKITVLGQEPDPESPAYTSPARVRFSCPECASLPKQLDLEAELVGGHWLVKSVR